MQRLNVPQFGNWESEVDVPYTAYFERAREDKSGRTMNPNDSREVPDIRSRSKSPVQVPSLQTKAKTREEKVKDVAISRLQQCVRQEDAAMRKLTDSPLHHATGQSAAMNLPHQGNRGLRDAEHGVSNSMSNGAKQQSEGYLRKLTNSSLPHDPTDQRVTSYSPLHHHGGLSPSSNPKRFMQQSRSLEQSPLHSHCQARVGGKGSGVSSPSWERKVSSQSSSHGQAPLTTGRSRLRSVVRGNENPNRSAAVPKFGDWDEKDPASADGYTHIFNRVREERQSEVGKVPVEPSETSATDVQKLPSNENSKRCCCFPWSGK